MDVGEVDFTQSFGVAPRGHWLLIENVKCSQAALEHPFRFSLEFGDLDHHVTRQAFFRLGSFEHVVFRHVKTVLVVIKVMDVVFVVNSFTRSVYF